MNNQRNYTRKNRNAVGGGSLNPMELTDTSMRSATNMSMAQGGDYANIHKEQHGGMAPVGYTGVLDESLRGAARVLPIDDSLRQIQGLSDQTGGKRKKARKGGKKSKKANRKSKKSKKSNRKGRKQTSRRRRTMKGGMRELGYMDANAPGMLLPPSLAAKALSTMNAEWKLAENPSSFAPKGF
jgi:hypothetical protein